MMERLLTRHLSRWLGRWPATAGLDIAGSRERERPGWDGKPHPALGVSSPAGGVLSVPTYAVASVTDQYAKDGDLDLAEPMAEAAGFRDLGWRAYGAG